MQYYIDKDSKLNTKNISVILINGAHAKVYKQLIKSLGIPVVIITDLDIERTEQEKGKGDDNNFVQLTDLKGRKSTNPTLKHFYGDTNDLSEIKDYVKQDNLMICSQIKDIDGFYATSFEEAFILTNADNKFLMIF